MARRQKKSKQKLFIIVFFILLLVMAQTILSGRNSIVKLKSSEVSYVEMICFTTGNMTSIKNSKDVKSIIKNLNALRGQKENIEINQNGNIDFINIYDKNFKKLEIIKFQNNVKINNNWYSLEKGSLNRLNILMNKYNKNN